MLAILIIFPLPLGFVTAGVASPVTPPRDESICLPMSRERIQTALRFTWTTSSQSASGKFSAGVLPVVSGQQGTFAFVPWTLPSLYSPAIDKNVNLLSQSTVHPLPCHEFREAFDRRIGAEIAYDDGCATPQGCDLVVCLDVVFAPLKG
jgi:hypothetical protein